MSNVKHTPGPWTVEEYGDFDCPNLVVHSDSENRVCFMATPGSNGDPAMIEADARLIAAAPELLRTLDDIEGIAAGSGTVNSLPHIAKLARAALAKAEPTS